MENPISLTYELALYRCPSIGPASFQKIMEIFPNLEDLFNCPAKNLREKGLSDSIIEYLQEPDWHGVEDDIRWSQQTGNCILSRQNPQYPQILHEISAAPPILFVRGDATALSSMQLAMVGSRNPTPAGVEIACQFAHELSKIGLTIISGLALGIDAASHQGALNAKGLTVAVMGNGIDQIYPLRHKKLAEQILEQNGAIISEFPTGVRALAANFPRRNRIISGLSIGVLVVEAAVQSGSLITAKYALEQGREIFAIPGSIHNPMAKGCHALIRQGAKLVESIQDIIDELEPLKKHVEEAAKPLVKKKPLEKAYARLVECVGFEVTSVDTIIRLSSLAAEKVSAMLTLLEIEGYVLAVGGGYVRSV